MTKSVLRVDDSYDNVRLDVFLAKALAEAPSRTFIKKQIESGRVTLNGQVCSSCHSKVRPGDEVGVDIEPVPDEAPQVLPESIPLDVFYEDEFLLVINKPSGMLVHPAGQRRCGTLVNALLARAGTLSDTDNPQRPGIVHRLDEETSGLMVVAKDNRTHVQLSRLFEKHRVRKRYVALVEGKMEFDEGVIDAPISRHPLHWDKKAVGFDDEAREAKTFYRVRRRFHEAATMVTLFPLSGRTHQLRVHLRHLGHPILGDGKYGSRGSFPRLALHAQALAFVHPRTKQYIEFCSTLPDEFLRFSP